MQLTDQPTTLTIRFTLIPHLKSKYLEWQSRFYQGILKTNGFISLEFISSGNDDFSWSIAQRFSSHETAFSWTQSLEYQTFLKELLKLSIPKSLKVEETSSKQQEKGITAVILTQVKPHQEEAFREWSAKIHEAEAKFPGFRGFYIQSPSKSQGNHWITLLQFDSVTNLDRWLLSEERKAVLKESDPLVESFETHSMPSPYMRWFYSSGPDAEIPTIWQQTMLVLLVLFPLIMLELKYLRFFTGHLNISLGTFIGNAISVTLISFPLMPLAIKGLNWWLHPKKNYWHRIFWGTLFVCMLYILEIYLFWDFL